MTSFRALLSILVLALAVAVSAAHGQEPERITHTLTSSASGQERAVTVRLPRSYHERDGGVYPVLYVLDGESNLEWSSARRPGRRSWISSRRAIRRVWRGDARPSRRP